MNELKILIIDDSKVEAEKSSTFVNRIIKEDGRFSPRIELCTDINSILTLALNNRYHLILLDFDLGEDGDGQSRSALDYIRALNERQPLTELIILTHHNNTQLAVKCIKSGASDFLPKSSEPVVRLSNGEIILKSAILAKKKIQELYRLANKNSGPTVSFTSRVMLKVEEDLRRLSQNKSPVLITGRTGAGKTYAAKRLSELSGQVHNQKNRVFCNENISAIPETLAEAILFGAERGA